MLPAMLRPRKRNPQTDKGKRVLWPQAHHHGSQHIRALGGTLSANGTYHFSDKARAPGRVIPFGTGGFSTVLLCSGQCWPTLGFNVGGGINYWRTAGRGLRLEFRDTVTKDYGATHLWEIRTGFSF
jgi:hypothetical protein